MNFTRMLYEQILEAVDYLNERSGLKPKTGIILGTGLGGLVDHIKVASEVPYEDIPYFPVSTVQGHAGKLVFGYLKNRPVVVMAGRFHYYEGYSMREVVFPVRVLKFLGIDQLCISNVTGSINQNIDAGDIVIVRDHINLQPDNPLRGENDERLGPRFPDMLNAYDHDYRSAAVNQGKALGLPVHEGVYVALQGPNLESPAEYAFLNRIGADVVGMSTVPEVIAAKHMGLKTLVLSLVTNKCFPLDSIKETTVEEVIALAEKRSPQLALLVANMVEYFNEKETTS